MKLQKLTKDKLAEIADRKICCCEKSVSYLQEMKDRYGIWEKIEFLVDDNARSQGVFRLMGKSLPVFGFFHLEQVELRDWAVIITSDYHREIYEKLCEMEHVFKNVDTVYYFASRETEYEEEYRKLYQNREFENLIVFRSGPHASSFMKGMDFGDNARALFEYMLANGYNSAYELVWLVKNPEEFISYSQYKNVTFLSFDWSVSDRKFERDQYYRALCLAKYLIFTDAYGFARNARPGQIRVQLWHGCGFKTRVNFTRCENRYEYTTVISELYARIHCQIYGLRADQVLVTGYAKQDWLFQPPDKQELEGFQLPGADKYIYWLPTFRTADKVLNYLNEYSLRSETGLPVADTQDKLKRLNELLVQNHICLVIKLHPFQDRSSVQCKGFSNIVMIENEEMFRNDIPINRLLSRADALISDYSSAAVDYLLLDRPMAFLLEDAEEYGASRGFIFDNIRDWLPGKEVFTFEGLCEFVEEIAGGVDITKEKRGRLRDNMHRYHDGNSCRRILEALKIRLV